MWDSLELELQAVVICLMKDLGTQFRSSGRIASAFNY